MHEYIKFRAIFSIVLILMAVVIAGSIAAGFTVVKRRNDNKEKVLKAPPTKTPDKPVTVVREKPMIGSAGAMDPALMYRI